MRAPPNAGKSRLFNALLGGERAIVSPVRGTTRDYLGISTVCDGLGIELVDTAGVETASTPIQARAQALGVGQINRADLLLDCRSADAGTAVLPDDLLRLVVWNKSDLAPSPFPQAIETSAATGLGLDRLRSAIADAMRDRADDDHALAGSGARCRDSLNRCGEALRAASECLGIGGGG